MQLVSTVRTPQCDADGTLKPLDSLELETLMLNLDAAIRVHARAHLFSWTQGLLQGLVSHEVLVCALRGADSPALRADSFSVAAADPGAFGETLLRDSPVAPRLIKTWEERRFRPLLCDAREQDSPAAGGAFARELERSGASQLLVHGTHDADGKMVSLFIFGCAPGSVGPRQAYLAQMAVPSLHAAWVRTLTDGRAKGIEGPKPAAACNITAREQEILKWVYIGKSNIEIGTILGISPLTVKNHVQKILRKLNVLNRTQAVGRALALRILST